MDGKGGYDKIDGVLGYEHSKRSVLAKRKGSPGASSSSDSSRSHSPKRRLQHSIANDDSGERNHSINEVLAGKKRRNLRPRRSSESSNEDQKSPIRNEDKVLRDTSVHSQKSLNDGLKYNTSVEQTSVQSKETRLNQLSSERDRSISVDRSSTSSDGRHSLAKIATEGIWPTSPERKCSIENVKKDSSPSKNSKSRALAPAEISHHTSEKKQELNEDKRPSKFRRSRSRSRSRSPNRHQRKDYSPSRDRRRSRDRHRDRSPRRRSPYSKTFSSRSRDHGRYNRNHRSRSHGRHRRSRSRSYERRRYRRDRSSSHDRHKKRRRSPSSSRSRSRGHSPRDRSKSKLAANVSKLGLLPLSTTAGAMTPQMALQQAMAAMSAQAQAITGIELPKYYNPAAVNPLKYAEQVQKRKLLWQTKTETTQEQPKSSIWNNLTFTQDQDGKMTQKFRKLMGIKGEGETVETETKEAAAADANSEPVALQKQEELFRNLDQQYEMARMSTHTHRGVGLGYSTQPIFPPLQKP